MTTQTITVRTATEDDAKAAARAKLAGALREIRPLIGPERFRDWAQKRCSVQFTRSRIEGTGLTVVEDQGQIRALGFVRPENLHNEEGGFYLGDFYVAEEGRGYGTALLEELARQAKARCGRYMWSLVFSDNTDARRFFEKRGWRHVGERPNGEVEGGNLAEYRLELQ